MIARHSETTPDLISTWLQKRSQKMHRRAFPAEGGRRYFLNSRWLVPPNSIHAPMVLRIGGFYTIPSAVAKRRVYSTSGQIIIKILALPSQQIQVTVIGTCTNPAVIEFLEAVLGEMGQRWPQVVIRRVEATKKRGGPIGTPEDQRIKIVRGWLRVQGRMNQEIYANSQGIAPSTLRRWQRELGDKGKL